MTTTEKNQLASLVQATVAAEAELSAAQSALHAALRLRDQSQALLSTFLDSLQTSDAPAEVKRGRPKGAKTHRPKNDGPTPVVIATSHSVYDAGTTHQTYQSDGALLPTPVGNLGLGLAERLGGVK